MTGDETIQRTIAYVKAELAGTESGHDWWHIYRVWSVAKKIARQEECDLLTVELAALLHDIADSKFHDGDESIGPAKAAQFMASLGIGNDIILHVANIIRHISFKGGHATSGFTSKELDVVQDADRLDAIGAIGIARAFSYGGYKGRSFYDPDIPPHLNMSKEEYKNSTAPTINHFYEKLLLLKDRMNTAAGRTIAVERHNFMLLYLEQFYKEWDGML